MAQFLIALIRVYQLLISPLLGGQCRFEPSCSRYGQQCIQRFGAWRGSLLAIKRILRCHPFSTPGYDPPPAACGHARCAGHCSTQHQPLGGPVAGSHFRSP